MNLQNNNIKLSKEQEEIDKLWNTYYSKGFKEFMTWDLEDEEIKEILENCLKQNKSYEEIYETAVINENIDY
jgi:Glu-tRNA(Gln) amidotransferase subunit E-like FAD-binding protein